MAELIRKAMLAAPAPSVVDALVVSVVDEGVGDPLGQVQETGGFHRVDPLVLRHRRIVDLVLVALRTMTGVEADRAATHGEDLPVPSFQSQVAFWFSVWSANRPEVVEQARAAADPDSDPWGYLVALGELLAEVA